MVSRDKSLKEDVTLENALPRAREAVAAMYAAINAQVPIVPVRISGAFEAIVAVMKSFFRYPGALKMKYFGQKSPVVLATGDE